MSNWRTGSDAAGRKTARISAPTLIADGADDQLDPVTNDRALARIIHGARLVLYPDAGHALPVPGLGALRGFGGIVPGRAPGLVGHVASASRPAR